MSEQDNAALIKKLYAAFAAGDAQTILDSVADKAEWVNHGPSTVPYAGNRSGKEQIRGFFQAIGDSTTGAKVLAEKIMTSGDMVITTGRYRAKVRDTGAEIDTPIAHLFTVRDGKVVRWEGFSDTAQVAAAHAGKAATGR